ncbi:MAG: hypothetical protein KGM49_01190 [Sphingomonadales bacterium]|nr:hypothetical protein [Sphingomonadales bacterium]
MSTVPLRLGPLGAKGYSIQRSGIRWLREDGQHCRANQPIGWFNIVVEPTRALSSGVPVFGDECELQVVVAPRISGRLSVESGVSRGGYLSVRSVDPWDPDTQIGSIETGGGDVGPDAGTLRLMVLAGRRMTDLANVHGSLLSGWHSRTRGWWCDAGEAPLTLLSQGVCDANGVVLGAQSAFLEMFEAARQALQIVYVPDHPIAPCVPILLDQISRTTAQFDAIAEDVHRHFAPGGNALVPQDWMFLGTMLSELQSVPLKDTYDIISANGLQQLRAPNAVLLSLAVEPQAILRHKSLGYHMHVMRHHQAAAGPAVRAWLSTAFEPVKRTIDMIRKDYEALIDRLKQQTGARVIILNRMSSSGREDVSNYMGFDAPLGDTLSNVAAKEWNLMLHDIAETRPLDIVDVDAVAAEMGGAEHLPDGIHQSGQMQSLLLQQILGFMEGLSPPRHQQAA